MNIQNVCDAIDNTKRLVLIKDNSNICFAVKQQQDILAEMRHAAAGALEKP